MIARSRLNDDTPLRYGMGVAVGKDVRGLDFIGHGGSIAGFTAQATWYPAAQMAVVVLMNSNGNIDPGAVAGELAAAVLPWTPPATARYTGDAAALVGRYQGPSRGRDMIIEVTQTPQGPAFSVNGAPARPLPWVEGLTFRQGNTFLTFRRAGGSTGAVTELRFDAGSAHYVLKRQ